MDEGKLFSLVRFFIAQCDSSEDIKNLLIEGGARHINYLSESVTHVISDTNCPDAEEAVELFDKPVVTPAWVYLSLKARKILPPEAFSPLKSIFRHVRASFSRDLTRHDTEILAATVTYYGGQVERETGRSTHFIAASSKPTEFQDGLNSDSNLKIVAPDWVLESVKQRVCCDETLFDPCLLLPPPPPPPPKQPTPPPLVIPTQEKERSMIESNATKGPQTQDSHAKSTVSRGNNHFDDGKAHKVDIISAQSQIRTQNPSQNQQYQTQQQSQQISTMQTLPPTQIGSRPRMATNIIRGSSPRFRQVIPSNIAQPRHATQAMPRMMVQDNQQLRRAPMDQNNTYRKMGPYPVSSEMQHMQQQQVSQSIQPYQQVEHQQVPMMGQPTRFQQPNMYQQHARPPYQNQMQQRMPANVMSPQHMHRFQDPNGQVVQQRPNQVYALQQSQPIASPNYQQGPIQRPPTYYNNNMGNMNMRMPPQGPMIRPLISNDQQMISEPLQQYPGAQAPQQFYPHQQQQHQQQQQQQQHHLQPQQQTHNQMVRTIQPQPAQTFQQPPPPVTQPRLQFSPNIPNAVNSHPPRGPRQPSGGQLETRLVPRPTNASQNNNERAPRGPRAPVTQHQPHPSMFDLKQELSYAQMKAKVPDLTEDIEYFNHADVFKPPKGKPFVACRFKLIEHLEVSGETRDTWCEQITGYGGQFVDDIEKATHIICETQTTPEFELAIEIGVRCVTLFWIRDVISQDLYEYPWKALHMPVAFKISDKPLKNQIVTTTNYRKSDRIEIKNMLEIAGAKYTDFLSSSNTLLLCGKAGGDKFERAIEWRVLIANCQLISDFLISGRDFSQMLDHARYQNFNREDQLKIDSYVLVRKLMKPWTKPISAVVIDPASEVNGVSTKDLPPSQPERDHDVATGGTNNVVAVTDEPKNGDKSDSMADMKPVDAPEPVEILKDEEQEVVKPPTALDNGYQLEDSGLQKDPPATPIATESSIKKGDKVEEQIIRRPPLRTSKAPIRVFTTSLHHDLVAQLKTQASQLGLKWAYDAKESTHLLLDRINPTANFVMAFSHASYILHFKWLTESHKFGQLLHEKEFILQDASGEHKYSFNLVHSLLKRSKRPGPLFDNYIFYITPTVIKAIKYIERMIESAGGLAATKKLPTKNQRAQMKADGKRFVIIADPSDHHLVDCIDTWGVDIMHNDAMETLIIQVDCRPHGREGPSQLGITVEDPISKKDSHHHKKDAFEQKKAQRLQPYHKEYQDHDYQNLDNGNFNRLDNVNCNDNSNTNSKAGSAISHPPVKNGNSDHHRTASSNGLQQIPKGLQITQIQPGSVIDVNGQFKVGDIIAEVNGVNLQRSFAEAQRTLKQFVVDHTNHGPLVLKVFRKTVPPSISSTSTPAESRHLVGALNTRKIGIKHRIRLRKAVNGFGIKIAERDNMHGTRHRPIFITAITTTGSAYQDGRLKEGDMLLEVNGMDLSGKSQPEVTKMLKSIGANEEVEFVVSRQENLANESSSTDGPGIYTYDIPLNDTKSAGLGLYLKYPRRTEDHKDLGIWIEKVITGGAAWKDGSLQPDDQILAINGINLLDLSNAEASETLTAAVCRGIGPEATPNTIRLKVQRRGPAVVEKILQGTNNGMEHFDVIPAEGQEQSSYSALTDKKINNSQDSYITALENTLQNNTPQHKTTTNMGNLSGSSNSQNSRSDSVMSPQTQASNSLGLTSSCNGKLDQNSGEKTNETTSSAISQITDTNSQSWDDESTDAPVGEDPFQRDGFGRQSISEKRHAQLSAWSTDTFRRNQRLREEQEQHRRLEEQMTRQCFEVAVDVHMPPPMQHSQLVSNSNSHDRVSRNRKINDSFRKAVDRSYEDSINVVPQVVPTYDLSIRQERSVDRLDNNRRITAWPATKIISSVANSTGSTTNEERYLITRMKNEQPARQIEEMGVQESNPNDNNNTVHKKSSSLLNKLLKFGSMKRKKKSSNKDKTTTTSYNQDGQTKEVEAKQQPSRTIDMPNHNSIGNANNINQQYTRVPIDHQHHNNVHNINNNLQQQHIQQLQQNSFTIYPHPQHVRLSAPSDQISAGHHIHQHSSLYSSGRSAQMMNPHVPSHAMNVRPTIYSGIPHQHPSAQWQSPYFQHPNAQWQSSYFQQPSGLWVSNSMVPTEMAPQLPPNNVYATLPHHHHPQHYNHVHNNGNNLQHQHYQQMQHNSFAM